MEWPCFCHHSSKTVLLAELDVVNLGSQLDRGRGGEQLAMCTCVPPRATLCPGAWMPFWGSQDGVWSGCVSATVAARLGSVSRIGRGELGSVLMEPCVLANWRYTYFFDNRRYCVRSELFNVEEQWSFIRASRRDIRNGVIQPPPSQSPPKSSQPVHPSEHTHLAPPPSVRVLPHR